MPACKTLLRESLLRTCCITQLRQPLVTAPAVSVRACCRPGRAPACGGPTQPADAQPTHPSSCQPSCHPAAARSPAKLPPSPHPAPTQPPPSPRPAPAQPPPAMHPPSPHPAPTQPPLMMVWLSVRVLRSQGKGRGAEGDWPHTANHSWLVPQQCCAPTAPDDAAHAPSPSLALSPGPEHLLSWSIVCSGRRSCAQHAHMRCDGSTSSGGRLGCPMQLLGQV